MKYNEMVKRNTSKLNKRVYRLHAGRQQEGNSDMPEVKSVISWQSENVNLEE